MTNFNFSPEDYFQVPTRIKQKIKYTVKERKTISNLLKNTTLDHKAIWDGDCSVSAKKVDRKKVTDRIKSELEKFQGNFCCYCGVSYILRSGRKGSKSFQREHIVPKSLYRNLTFTQLNLALACARCNYDYKGDYDPIIKNRKRYRRMKFSIVHPRLDNWSSHIEMDPVSGVLSHTSNKGEKTITLFGLNEPNEVFLRGACLNAKKTPLTNNLKLSIQKPMTKI